MDSYHAQLLGVFVRSAPIRALFGSPTTQINSVLSPPLRGIRQSFSPLRVDQTQNLSSDELYICPPLGFRSFMALINLTPPLGGWLGKR